MMRRSGTRCTWIVASVMIPRRPSLPSTISRTLGPVAVEVAQALAAGVDDAVERVGRDVRGADRGLERGAQLAAEGWLGDVELVEADRARGELISADVDRALDERRQLG